MAQNQVTEAAIQVLNTGDGSNVRATEAAIQVLNTGDGSTVRATEVALQVLSTVAFIAGSAAQQPVVIIIQ